MFLIPGYDQALTSGYLKNLLIPGDHLLRRGNLNLRNISCTCTIVRMRMLNAGRRMRMLTSIFNFRSIHAAARVFVKLMASTTRTVLVCIGERKRPGGDQS